MADLDGRVGRVYSRDPPGVTSSPVGLVLRTRPALPWWIRILRESGLAGKCQAASGSKAITDPTASSRGCRIGRAATRAAPRQYPRRRRGRVARFAPAPRRSASPVPGRTSSPPGPAPSPDAVSRLPALLPHCTPCPPRSPAPAETNARAVPPASPAGALGDGQLHWRPGTVAATGAALVSGAAFS